MDPVTSWTPEQVLSWMKGLDDVLQQYGPAFLENGIIGEALLCLSHAKLDDLGVKLLGHQELLLEAIDLLCALHYTTDSENLYKATQKLTSACKALQTGMGLAATGPDRARIARQSLPSELLILIVQILNSARSVLAWLSRLQTYKDFVMARRLLAKFCFDLTQIAEQVSYLATLAIYDVTLGIVLTCVLSGVECRVEDWKSELNARNIVSHLWYRCSKHLIPLWNEELVLLLNLCLPLFTHPHTLLSWGCPKCPDPSMQRYLLLQDYTSEKTELQIVVSILQIFINFFSPRRLHHTTVSILLYPPHLPLTLHPPACPPSPHP
uniref:SAM domain-containing protein n=1 Tax=Eptatretus burgeri TaxID=7764 RepID=A0A8C4NNK6_EPTBU